MQCNACMVLDACLLLFPAGPTILYILYTRTRYTDRTRMLCYIYRLQVQAAEQKQSCGENQIRLPHACIGDYINDIIQLIPLPPIARISRHVNFLPIAVRWVPFQRQPPPLFKPHECNPSSYTTRAHCIASHCIRLSHLTLHRSIHRISTKLTQSTTSRVEC